MEPTQFIMIIKSVEEILIFESTEGGKRVYSRKPGETTRTLIHEDPALLEQEKENQHWLIWRDILHHAKDNPALSDVIHQAEMIYNLIKDEK